MTKLDYMQLKNFEIEKMVELELNKDTKEIGTNIIGQNRAVEAIRFGLEIDSFGYNIFLAGEASSGKFTLARDFATKKSKTKKAPKDMIYIYNFKNPKEPCLIQLKAGSGKVFKKDMEELIEELLAEIPNIISSQDFEESKTSISKEYGKKRDEIIKLISTEAKKYDFGVKTTGSGIYFMPIVDGVIITEEEYNNLEDVKKEEIMERSSDLQENVTDVMNKMREFDILSKSEIEDLEFTNLLFAVGEVFSKIFEKYIDNEEILSYLKSAKEDILSNLEAFLTESQPQEDDIMSMLPWSPKKDTEDPLNKYKINLFVDNSHLSCAPVITSHIATYQNIVGEVEFDSDYGNFSTDFMKIRPGLLHKANGGYLILRAKDINVFALEVLLRSLKSQEVTIEPIKELQTIAINSICPQKLTSLDVKVILVGDFYLYDILYNYEEDFRKLFKIRGDFDYEMKVNYESIKQILNCIKDFEIKSKFDVTKDAKVSIVEYCARLSGHKNRFTTNLSYVAEVLEEAKAWCTLSDVDTIDSQFIKKSITEKINRKRMYEEKLTNLIDEDIIMISTTGARVGQINGLAVIDMEEYSFAKPTKITATSYAGKAGIVNIEKEARLSGKVHDKGVAVLSGYLGNTYAREFPLSVSIRIAFEQNYSGIDGDSASAAELYAIISSISEVAITQEIAITGSLNQFGEIQAIGGVTEKIEGFYDTCLQKGLTGSQGVIIPIQNVADLTLKDEVIKAVKDGQFHIHAIEHINQGMELLMGDLAENIHKKVIDKLKVYNDTSSDEN